MSAKADTSLDIARAVAGLVDQRARLEDRLADLHLAAAALAGAQIAAPAAALLSGVEAAIAGMDAELTRLADAVHELAEHVAQTSSLEAWESGPLAQLAQSGGAAAAFAIAQVLFVRCGGSQFALPLDVVREIRGFRGAAPAKAWRDRELNVMPLAPALGLAAASSAAADRKLVVLDEPAGTALLVDEVTRQDELVVRPLGPLVPGPFLGAVAGLRNELVLVLDPAALMNEQ